MFNIKIMHNIDYVDVGNRFNLIKIKVRGHCFKYFKTYLSGKIYRTDCRVYCANKITSSGLS